jgi:hypothetical protein
MHQNMAGHDKCRTASARGRIERGSRALRLGDEFGVLHQLVECRTQPAMRVAGTAP